MQCSDSIIDMIDAMNFLFQRFRFEKGQEIMVNAQHSFLDDILWWTNHRERIANQNRNERIGRGVGESRRIDEFPSGMTHIERSSDGKV